MHDSFASTAVSDIASASWTDHARITNRLAHGSHGVRGRESCRAAERVRRDFVQLPDPQPASSPQQSGRPAHLLPVLSRAGASHAARRITNRPMRRASWRMRVVPNMFPAVMPAGEIATLAASCPLKASFADATAVAAIGAHEVIIESPRHVDRMSVTVGAGAARRAGNLCRSDFGNGATTADFAYGLVFKNQGRGPALRLRICTASSSRCRVSRRPWRPSCDRAAHRFRQHRSCPYCRHHRTGACGRCPDRSTTRDEFVAFCPFASVQPYEVWLMPAQHEPFVRGFAVRQFGPARSPSFIELLRRIEAIVPDSAYNMLLRTAPWLGGGHDWCHWRIEILPAYNAFAGFELASGMFINSLAPERAASKLRSI